LEIGIIQKRILNYSFFELKRIFFLSNFCIHTFYYIIFSRNKYQEIIDTQLLVFWITIFEEKKTRSGAYQLISKLNMTKNLKNSLVPIKSKDHTSLSNISQVKNVTRALALAF
jgi:hypothetical protein